MVIGALAGEPTNDNFANAEVLSGTVQVHVTRSNIGATKETNEPNHAGNVGGKSVWFSWTAPMTRLMQVTTNRSATNLNTLVGVYAGQNINGFVINSNDDIDSATNVRSHVVFLAFAGTTYRIAVDGYSDGVTPAADGPFRLDIQPFFMHQGADYDADGMTDLSVFRPSTGEWLVNGTTRSTTTHWGTNGDIPVVVGRNYIPSPTIFHPFTGMWYLHSNTTATYFPFGRSGDIPVSENFSQNDSSFAVYRPSNGTWYINTFNNSVLYYKFGLQGDIPVAGHYSPDSAADVAVFRPSNGTWYFMLRDSIISESGTFRAVKFGQAGDKTVPADYDGDGLLDVAVYRPSTGTWWILRSSNGQVNTYRWGIAEDIPTTGDFDGDGYSDYAVFRPSTATWYILNSRTLETKIRQFGQTGDIPMTANNTY